MKMFCSFVPVLCAFSLAALAAAPEIYAVTASSPDTANDLSAQPKTGNARDLVVTTQANLSSEPKSHIQITIRDSNGNAPKNVSIVQNFQEKRNNGTSYYPHTSFRNGKLSNRNVRFNADGTFLIPASENKFNLILSHPTGWANIHSKDLKKGMSIVLTPWQTIQGKAFVGDKPASGAKVHYSYIGQLFHSDKEELSERIHFDATAVVDANGDFEIKHAIPGLGIIGTEQDNIRSRRVWLIAGKKHEVYLGSVGRPVKGRLVMPAKLTGQGKLPYYFTIQRADVEDRPDSTSVLRESELLRKKKFTKEEKDAADLQSFEREERLQIRNINGDASDDGSFFVKDVLPGKYVLEIQHPFKAKRTFEVKLDSGKLFMEEPVDLGELNFDAD